MSSHRKSTPRAVSLASVTIMSILVLVVIAANLWMVMGPVVDARHVTGAAMGTLLALALAGQAIGRATDYADQRDRDRDREWFKDRWEKTMAAGLDHRVLELTPSSRDGVIPLPEPVITQPVEPEIDSALFESEDDGARALEQAEQQRERQREKDRELLGEGTVDLSVSGVVRELIKVPAPRP